MSDGRLEAAADELYGLAPDQFIARRDALAKAAKAEGDGESAKAVKALRRPTVSAWLVNLLTRAHGDDVERLFAIGEALRQAQSALDGSRMKQLSGERTTVVEALSRQARQLASANEQSVTAAVARDLDETLRAAVVDPLAAAAVGSGRLTRALAYAGFGEVDISEATATPLEPPSPPTNDIRPEQPAPPKRPSSKCSSSKKAASTEQQPPRLQESAKARKEAAKRAGAEQAAVEAMQQLEAATRQAQQAQQQREAADATIADLERQMDEARTALAESKQQHTRATRARQRAQRNAATAKQTLDDLLS